VIKKKYVAPKPPVATNEQTTDYSHLYSSFYDIFVGY
jgi:hypothetical protein